LGSEAIGAVAVWLDAELDNHIAAGIAAALQLP